MVSNTSKHIKNTAMACAWQKAGIDLGIEFMSPFAFKASSGRKFICSGLLPDFGGSGGTVIYSRFDFITDEEWDKADNTIYELGYYRSALNPLYYEKYDRATFIETLNDWGWYGLEDKIPKWFTGSFYCHG